MVSYFKFFYNQRRLSGVPIEKEDSLFVKPKYSDKEVEYCILSNPFRRFETMNMMHHTKTLGIIEIDQIIWKKLNDTKKATIIDICDRKIEQYYNTLEQKAKR